MCRIKFCIFWYQSGICSMFIAVFIKERQGFLMTQPKLVPINFRFNFILKALISVRNCSRHVVSVILILIFRVRFHTGNVNITYVMRYDQWFYISNKVCTLVQKCSSICSSYVTTSVFTSYFCIAYVIKYYIQITYVMTDLFVCRSLLLYVASELH